MAARRVAGDDGHTRLVGWLKVILPLLALAILSTLFLISRTIDPEGAIPYAEVDIAERVREPRMTAPAYAGVTDDGSTLTLTAEEARPGQDDGGSASGVSADLSTPDGAHTQFSAARAAVSERDGLMLLDGGVQITTSSGYNLSTEALQVALDRTKAQSNVPVTASGPPGKITSGGMEIRQDTATPGVYVLVFNNHVTLIYQPN